MLGFSFFGSGQNAAIMFVRSSRGTSAPARRTARRRLPAARWVRLAAQGRDDLLAEPAVDPRARHRQRLQPSPAGPLRPRLSKAGRGPQPAARPGIAKQSRDRRSARGSGGQPAAARDVDRIKARSLGLPITDINNTLSIAFGSAYANDFTARGGCCGWCSRPSHPAHDARRHPRSSASPMREGEMVPFSAFTTAEWTAGPPQLQRYNGFPSMAVSGSAAPGNSTGDAMEEMAPLVGQLPPGIGFEWTGLSFEEQQAAGQVPLLLACRCWSCSCCWPRSTRAGRSRWRCCWSCRSGVLGALCSASFAACRWTSISTSASSPSSACPRRTRS